tara:strand:+ start:183 stop:308 length:126 start_codon:yes stop_codon:yes gene_type:complete
MYFNKKEGQAPLHFNLHDANITLLMIHASVSQFGYKKVTLV